MCTRTNCKAVLNGNVRMLPDKQFLRRALVYTVALFAVLGICYFTHHSSYGQGSSATRHSDSPTQGIAAFEFYDSSAESVAAPLFVEYSTWLRDGSFNEAHLLANKIDACFTNQTDREAFWIKRIPALRAKQLVLISPCDICTNGLCPVCRGVLQRPCTYGICKTCRGTGICPRCHGAKTLTCPTCGGMGQIVHTETSTCSQCGGTGQVHLQMSQGFTLCQSCNGTGKTRTTSSSDCQTCRGTGRIACDACDGTGKCPSCNGRGHDPSCSYCGGTKFITTNCSTCGGTGKCPKCNGSQVVHLRLRVDSDWLNLHEATVGVVPASSISTQTIAALSAKHRTTVNPINGDIECYTDSKDTHWIKITLLH